MRTRNPIVVLGPDGKPLAGAKVETKNRPAGTVASVYAGETGGTAGSNPATTDEHGKVVQWLERGAYESLVTAAGMVAYTEPWDSAPGSNAAIDEPWLSVTLQASLAEMETDIVDLETALAGSLHAPAAAWPGVATARAEGEEVEGHPTKWTQVCLASTGSCTVRLTIGGKVVPAAGALVAIAPFTCFFLLPPGVKYRCEKVAAGSWVVTSAHQVFG